MVRAIDLADVEVVTWSCAGGPESRPYQIPPVIVHVDALLCCLIWGHKDVTGGGIRFVEDGDIEEGALDVGTLLRVSSQSEYMFVAQVTD
jgi:hypothetical protein